MLDCPISRLAKSALQGLQCNGYPCPSDIIHHTEFTRTQRGSWFSAGDDGRPLIPAALASACFAAAGH